VSDRILRSLHDHCLGTTESELDFLVKAFVFAEAYQDVLYAPFHSPLILIGRKGTGKTALLKYLDLKSASSGIITLYLKPDDMPLLEGIGDAKETATIKRKAYQALISSLAVKVGTNIRGLLGRKEKKLFDKAVVEGARTHDAVQACMHGLSKFGSVVTSIDFSKLLPAGENLKSTALLNSLQTNFEKSNTALFLLLDDIDQVASIQDREQINRIWRFMLAAKRLTEELPNMKTIISLRTEIWTLIERDESGQRDQIDHIRQLLRRLDPSEEIIKEIVLRRLRVVARKHNLPTDNSIFREFFTSPKVILPTSKDQKRYWEDYITKSSRGRPRDAIQLLGLLAKESISQRQTRISQDAVNSAAEKYSEQRVNDLTREYTLDCPVVREIINSLASLDFILTTNSVLNHLMSLPTRFSVNIRGNTIHQDNRDDIFKLWKFMHEMGLINPRIPDKREFKVEKLRSSQTV